MNIHIFSIAKQERSALAQLEQEYLKRLPWEVSQHIISPIQEHSKAVQKRKEGERLLAATPKNSTIIALDECGKHLTSHGFAEKIQLFQDHGTKHISFLIGGAFGHGDELRKASDLVLSLSSMTLPHKLARLFLVEQIYRAWTISHHHPYHK